mmetsp:Transcript_36378/g.85340  ORF Transcript_36378/g.85340 Transcript_36378/m.85340 type:complete len:561 (+) Transcript_36378:46-1728(+)
MAVQSTMGGQGSLSRGLVAAAAVAAWRAGNSFTAAPLLSSRAPRTAPVDGQGRISEYAADGSAHLKSSGLAFGAAAAAVVAGTRASSAQKSKSSRRNEKVSISRSARGGQWGPRGSGWDEAQLAAERSRVEGLPGPEPGYTGPHYEGAASITDDFISSLISMQEQGILLPKKYAYRMVLDVIDLLRREATFPEVNVVPGQTLTVVGDLHGQYWDFMNILKLAGRPSATSPFIFNGDFVDRGSWSIEVIMVLFAFKLQNPGHVHMNRGNHEMIETNILYGFCGEVAAKYDTGLFDLFSDAFRHLPLGHLVDKRVLVLHGGLPGPDPRIWMPGQTHDPTDAIPMTTLPSLAQMQAVDRYTEVTPDSYANSIGPTTTEKWVTDERMMIDILWGDPRGGDGYGPSYRKGKGVYMYGPDVTAAFCQQNNLQCIIRSHEVKGDGYRWDHQQLITVFSAPNYLDTGNNKGAFLKVTSPGAGQNLNIQPVNYEAVPHPDLQPMHWQRYFMENFPHLTRKMKKKVQAGGFDEFGDSDFEGLMNFDEWEPDEAEQFQEAFKVDEYGRPLQ